MAAKRSLKAARSEIEWGILAQATLIGATLAIIGNIIILNMGRAFGIPFELLPPGGAGLEPLPVIVVMAASIVPAIAAAILLAILMRAVDRPFLIFWVVAAIVLYFSFSGPSSTPTDSAATVRGLNTMHVWTALAIVSAITALARPENAS